MSDRPIGAFLDPFELAFKRALRIVMSEYGKTEEEARNWVFDDDYFNAWDFGGDWDGDKWTEDQSKIEYAYPEDCRTENAPVAGKLEES